MTLDDIRKYLAEEGALKFMLDTTCVSTAQEHINNHYYQTGRICMLQDILKWEQKLREREFRVRIKKGTL